MKVVHFSTNGGGGGAAVAASRLHVSLLDSHVESSLVVASKVSDVPMISGVSGIRAKTYPVASRWGISLLKPSATFSPDVLGSPSAAVLPFVDGVDIIHLHWVANFLTSHSIFKLHQRSKAPVVWTLMDLAPITGGCHYTSNCEGYTQKCGHCPQIHSNFRYDLSRWTWRQKNRYLADVPITIVAPTQWVADRVKKSSLFRSARIEVIPLGIDSKIFRPVDMAVARDLLNLPLDKKLVFFGATALLEERKGMEYLVRALEILKMNLSDTCPELASNIVLLIAGSRRVADSLSLPFPSHCLGHLNNDLSLALAYQAADLFVCPSVEDAGPMMIPESMLCGTPVVAFDMGGAPDLITSMQNGYLASHADSTDLAHGMYLLLTSDDSHPIRLSASETAVAKHAPSIVASSYLKLYNSLIESSIG